MSQPDRNQIEETMKTIQNQYIDAADQILKERYDEENWARDAFADKPTRDGLPSRPIRPTGQLTFMDAQREAYEKRQPRADIFSASSLMKCQFKPLQWAVEGLLPEGCVLFAGRPKLGKSWFAYLIGLAISVGGHVLGKIKVQKGEVLYLALEDGKRRLQARFKQIQRGGPVPDTLHLAVTWPRMDEGGLEDLELWLQSHPSARLIIIDTLQRVRPQNRTTGSVYENDYNSLALLADLARQFSVCILVVHHTRKTDAEDAFDTVSGSTGLTGAVDATMVLKRSRNRGDAVLHITGRDVEEAEKALEFDRKTMTWILLGDAEEIKRKTEATDILEFLAEATEPLGPKQIAEALDKNEGSVRKILSRLAKDNQIKVVSYGKYSAITRPRGETETKQE